MNDTKKPALGDRPAFANSTANSDGLTIRQLAELMLTAALVGAGTAAGNKNLAVMATVERAQAVADELLRHWELRELSEANAAYMAARHGRRVPS